MKRYMVHYEGDRDTSAARGEGCLLPDHDEFYGSASTLQTAKRYIREIRAEHWDRDPHNFRIYDITLEQPYAHPVYTEE